MFKLAERRGANCGVHCSEEGLYLGGVSLIERNDGVGYQLRDAAELEMLLGAAYESPPDLARSVARLESVLGYLQQGDLPLAQIAALQLQFSELREDRLAGLARTDELLKANFNPAQPRDDKGRWTGDGDAAAVLPVRSPQRSPRVNPRTWESFPNSDFRSRLAIAERTADRPHFGYREVLDRTDANGQRHIALGRYQMTPGGLQAAGMIDRSGAWTGKYGIHSRSQFLANPDAQERALSDFLDATERQLRAAGAFEHIGDSIDGIRDRFTVTRAGLIAAGHREGATATAGYLAKVAANGFSSKGLQLSDAQLAIETHLRIFADVSYQ